MVSHSEERLVLVGADGHVRGAPERPQTGELYNKFAFQALGLWDGPSDRAEHVLH